MKKQTYIVIVLVLLIIGITYFTMAQPAKNTKEYVLNYIEKKGVDNITWKDFDYLPNKDVGSGAIVKVYELQDGSVLMISGIEKPMSISIRENDKETFLKKWE